MATVWKLLALWVGVDMEIYINNVCLQVEKGIKCKNILKENEIAIVDGYQLDADEELTDGDSVITVRRGEMVKENQLRQMLTARHSVGVADKLAAAKVAVCGLGGLGSNIAVMLARSGVGELLLIDFDTVEPTNLNRQAYFIDDLGKAKTQAISEQITRINPYCKVVSKQIKLDENNVINLLKGYNYVVEALDRVESKASIINALLTASDCVIVAGSGMAGYYSSNEIVTVKKHKRLYVCGDEYNESRRGNGLMSARVGICAGHQANMVIRLILGETNA